MQGNLDVRVVDASACEFEHRDDGVLVPRVNPKEIGTHGRGFFGLGHLGLWEGEELAQKRCLFSDGVPNGMNALDHAGLAKEVLMGVPCFIPVIFVKLFVNEQRRQLVSGGVRG